MVRPDGMRLLILGVYAAGLVAAVLLSLAGVVVAATYASSSSVGFGFDLAGIAVLGLVVLDAAATWLWRRAESPG